MHLSGGDEDERTTCNGVPLRTIEEEPFSSGNQISFIPAMRFLRIVPAGLVQFDRKRPV